MAKKRKKKKNPHTSPKKKINLKLNRKQKVLLGSFLILFGIALFIAFFSFLFSWKVDQSTLTEFTDRSVEAQNWLKKFGRSEERRVGKERRARGVRYQYKEKKENRES